MLHIHFGAGKLGLGLVAPFFRKSDSELYLLNRAAKGRDPEGGKGPSLTADRRNALLRDHPEHHYFIRNPRAEASDRQTIGYDRFFDFAADGIGDTIRAIVAESSRKGDGIVVTASIKDLSAYEPVIHALNTLVDLKEKSGEPMGRIFLVACENAFDAHDLFEDEAHGERIAPGARAHVTCVRALVDRICVGLEEDHTTPHPTLSVLAEEYGSLKLDLSPETEPLVDLCRGSRIEFSRHVEAEKQLKSWLLNGTHWLIALSAIRPGDPPTDLKLNEYINASPENREFARAALEEMSEGIALVLRDDPQYEAFVRDVDVDDYLAGARKVIIERFSSTDDPISRILSRFRAPSPEDHGTIQSFHKRFAERIDRPLEAYAAEHGVVPPAASRSLFNLHRLLAEGQFVDASLT